ncbi:hypothetical protein GIB67_039009 [Kingdonia uniflora]|uniref:Uncharacterized protein n=1 Tax=Kingdonia uniflora TaxID=39325 RepID=A0A7J7LKQ0_9MAGN|nr:hypothetical protein GIB67_039009 [Kingdonia uniflora]
MMEEIVNYVERSIESGEPNKVEEGEWGSYVEEQGLWFRAFIPGKGEESVYYQVPCLAKWKKDRGIGEGHGRAPLLLGAVTVQEIVKSISGDVAENLKVAPIEVEMSLLKRKRHEEEGSTRTKPYASTKMAELELKYYSMATMDPDQLDTEYYEHTFVFEDQYDRVKELKAELKMEKEQKAEEARAAVKLVTK